MPTDCVAQGQMREWPHFNPSLDAGQGMSISSIPISVAYIMKHFLRLFKEKEPCARWSTCREKAVLFFPFLHSLPWRSSWVRTLLFISLHIFKSSSHLFVYSFWLSLRIVEVWMQTCVGRMCAVCAMCAEARGRHPGHSFNTLYLFSLRQTLPLHWEFRF